MPSKRLDLMAWERRKVILLEEVVDAHAQQLGDQTYVIPMVEPVEEMYAFTAVAKSDTESGGTDIEHTACSLDPAP